MHHTGFKQSDELLDMMQDLSDKVREIIAGRLTMRQKQVIQKIFFEELTQTEVASELGLCQPTIHKILKGNIDYQNGGKRYGGALKKIKKICDNDPEVQKILFDINELKRTLEID